MFCFPLFWTVKTLELVRNFSFYFFLLWSGFCGMKHVSLAILLQKHVSLRFLLFPANKKIIETLPELLLCFLLKRLTDPAKQKEHWNAKECLCYSLHILSSNSLDQPTGPERQIARYTWKTDRSRNVSIFLQPVKVPNPSVYNTAHQPGCWGARRHADPMAVHQLVSLLKIITATC